MESNNEIKFCSHRVEETGYLSNFYRAAFTLDDKEWMTTEHYFQAAKFFETDPDYAEKVRLAEDPMTAKNIARAVDNKRSDWEEVKYEIMKKCIIEKFRQHEDIRKKLLNTGDAKLIEHTKKDSVWGDGGDGTGTNLLGKCLMEVREHFTKEKIE
jgi:ribA/ribD-fused uncharacterized protein